MDLPADESDDHRGGKNSQPAQAVSDLGLLELWQRDGAGRIAGACGCGAQVECDIANRLVAVLAVFLDALADDAP